MKKPFFTGLLMSFVAGMLLVGMPSFADANPASFQSVNYRTKYIRHRGFMGYITDIKSDLDKKDSSFYIRKGLYGAGTVSLESVNYPGYFLRHQGFVIKLHKKATDALYLKDASFYIRKGLAPGGLSFESVNYRGHYIRHCSFRLFIDNNKRGNRACNPAVFKGDVTFRQVPALASSFPQCMAKCAKGKAGKGCRHACRKQYNPSLYGCTTACKGRGKALRSCRKSCRTRFSPKRQACLNACKKAPKGAARRSCKRTCRHTVIN